MDKKNDSNKNKISGVPELDKLRKVLDDMPPPREFLKTRNKMTIIDNLKDEIMRVRNIGYSYTEIAKILERNGLPITHGALRTYIRRSTGTEERKEKNH